MLIFTTSRKPHKTQHKATAAKPDRDDNLNVQFLPIKNRATPKTIKIIIGIKKAGTTKYSLQKRATATGIDIVNATIASNIAFMRTIEKKLTGKLQICPLQLHYLQHIE